MCAIWPAAKSHAYSYSHTDGNPMHGEMFTDAAAASNPSASPVGRYSKVDTTEFDGSFPGGAPE